MSLFAGIVIGALAVVFIGLLLFLSAYAKGMSR